MHFDTTEEKVCVTQLILSKMTSDNILKNSSFKRALLMYEYVLYTIWWYHNLLNVNYTPFENEHDRVWSEFEHSTMPVMPIHKYKLRVTAVSKASANFWVVIIEGYSHEDQILV